jgi:hypothetical protein
MSRHAPRSAFVPTIDPACPDGRDLVPVARAARHDGWTPERQVAFLNALATHHNVSAAARSVGMSRSSAYKLRARLKGEPFDMAWGAAFQCAFDALGHAALDRALNGVERPHYYKGELVGTSRVFDERLTVALLAMRHGFLRDPLPGTHPGAAYDTDDFRGLVDRVRHGPESWDGYDEEDDESGEEDAGGAYAGFADEGDDADRD